MSRYNGEMSEIMQEKMNKCKDDVFDIDGGIDLEMQSKRRR